MSTMFEWCEEKLTLRYLEGRGVVGHHLAFYFLAMVIV